MIWWVDTVSAYTVHCFELGEDKNKEKEGKRMMWWGRQQAFLDTGMKVLFQETY